MKWEYKTVIEDTPMWSNELALHGEQGWELCGILEYARNYYFYFKRLIREED